MSIKTPVGLLFLLIADNIACYVKHSSRKKERWKKFANLLHILIGNNFQY